ncbi:MAG TPA: protein-L-isoaspartate(D-aspartate) O-methyltransferase [Candidatus Marinimicrobia bacterium]|jgi:protein-L-isoaspartate(D-aspartate) O-methyltransferase|nr:protein-L-isoaspartate(D-aspartate) O-methyltransferase [Candidatus Neomarinimicrobiota bacterium]
MHKPFIENMRKDMVKNQLRQRGILDDRVLDVMGDVPRHLFVAEDLWNEAYMDGPLPIGFDQTISQPYIVAFMTEVLKVEQQHSVLEIGTGCGYQSAVLSSLAKHVISLERIKELAESAKRRLRKLDYSNVDVVHGNGWNGYIQKAPFDRIIVTAGANKIPKALLGQLANGGIMIIPVGKIMFSQTLRIISKDSNGNVTKQTSLPVRFVRLVNK